MDISSFKVVNFPDGHQHVVSDKDLKGDNILTATIRTFNDLFLIAQIKRIHPEFENLVIKYLLAGRCDRRFSPGEANDLEIVCEYINSLKFKTVQVVKPHSIKTLELIKNCKELDYTHTLLIECIKDNNIKQVCFVSPDEGASKWISKYKLSPLIQGAKKRDQNGAVAGVQFSGFPLDCSNFVIVDDLCDGGGTFIAIAKEIHLRFPQAKVYLVVTHAIFSKGFEPFEGHIERIYCTNSFASFNNKLVRQIKI